LVTSGDPTHPLMFHPPPPPYNFGPFLTICQTVYSVVGCLGGGLPSFFWGGVVMGEFYFFFVGGGAGFIWGVAWGGHTPTLGCWDPFFYPNQKTTSPPHPWVPPRNVCFKNLFRLESVRFFFFLCCSHSLGIRAGYSAPVLFFTFFFLLLGCTDFFFSHSNLIFCVFCRCVEYKLFSPHCFLRFFPHSALGLIGNQSTQLCKLFGGACFYVAPLLGLHVPHITCPNFSLSFKPHHPVGLQKRGRGPTHL